MHMLLSFIAIMVIAFVMFSYLGVLAIIVLLGMSTLWIVHIGYPELAIIWLGFWIFFLLRPFSSSSKNERSRSG